MTMRFARAPRLALAGLLLATTGPFARAQDPALPAAATAPAAAANSAALTGIPTPDPTVFVPLGAPITSGTSSEATETSIQKSLGPYGDPGGLRAFLASKGIQYNFTYIAETLGNPTGGFKRGATFEGRLDGELDVDLEKLAGLKGATFHSDFYQIHGRGLSTFNLMDLYTVSGIEAYPDTKLYEAWFEQKFLDDKLAVRVGQLAADTEFMVSQTASVFVNSSFGWPAIWANNLPSGGPAFPLATPGMQVKIQPNEHFLLKTALFNGDPAGNYIPGVNNLIPQLRDIGGVSFNVRNPPLLLSEAQVFYNRQKDAKQLPGTIKVGYFHHFEAFPAFNVPPGMISSVRGDDGAYAMIDQSVYREEGREQGASVFLRVAGAPGDRNLINVYIDGGVAYQGLLPGRDDDTVAISAAYAHISPRVSQFDIAGGAAPLIRDYQALIEATYQYVVTGGFTLQPDFQYVIHPGANGVGDPTTGQPLKNAAVYGLRATIVY